MYSPERKTLPPIRFDISYTSVHAAEGPTGKDLKKCGNVTTHVHVYKGKVLAFQPCREPSCSHRPLPAVHGPPTTCTIIATQSSSTWMTHNAHTPSLIITATLRYTPSCVKHQARPAPGTSQQAAPVCLLPCVQRRLDSRPPYRCDTLASNSVPQSTTEPVIHKRAGHDRGPSI